MNNLTYPFQIPPLPFDADALEPYFDARTIRIHHNDLHRIYVERLNSVLKNYPEFYEITIEKLLKQLNKIPLVIRTAVRTNGGGHLNHALFWSLIGTPDQTVPESPLHEALKSSFGSAKSFHAKFREVATSHFASGWVFLVADSLKNTLEVLALPDHHCVLGTHQTVLLICDVWEHAYYLKHEQKRADYVDFWWQVANWQAAARRFVAPQQVAA